MTMTSETAPDLAATLEILAALVAFDTTSRHSNLELIAWVEAWLGRHGIASHRTPDATGTKASLFASIGPKDQPGHVLSGHTDVVPVDGQDWASDPFRLSIRDGKAYGRGAVDMKGFVACCLATVPAMAAAPLRRPIHLALSYDEEVGCVGVRPMLHRLAAGEFGIAPPLAAFIGEPTAMHVVIGHKGKRSIRVRVRGSHAHSSLAPLYVNAVEFGARLVAFIRDQAERLASTGARDALYDISHSTAHVGMFSGGTALNIVPASAEIVYEYRVIAEDDADALVEEAQAYAREVLEPTMRAVDPASGIDFEVYTSFAGLDTEPGAPVVSLAKRLAGRNDHSKVAFGTEAGLFTALAGIPAVVIGPGSIELAHKADEFIGLGDLAQCNRFLANLVAESCI
jgi:acetylornithine deacetylase